MSKVKLTCPIFEVGVKNYLYGDDVLSLALAADAASVKYNIDILFITPYTEIRRVADSVRRLIVLAPYMDTLRPGRGMAGILPEALKAAGARGVVINHCEKPVTLAEIKATIERADKMDMLSFVCAGSIAEAQATAHFHPDIINPELPELIGSNGGCDMLFMRESMQAVKTIDPNIIVEQAAGLTCGRHMYDLILAGAEAVGSASGVCLAPDPAGMLDEMAANVRKGWDERKKTA
jgi:triosephosphate isomerase